MPINIDEDNLRSGLLGLVVALVEVIQEVLVREALRRIDSGQLQDMEVDRLGTGLMELDEAIERIKAENDLDETVSRVRSDLDRLVEESLDGIVNPSRWSEAE
jgi:hypothetical protein